MILLSMDDCWEKSPRITSLIEKQNKHIDNSLMPFNPEYTHTLQSNNLTQTSQHSY